MELHPDKGGDEEDMKLLNNAYHTLMDEQKRKAYKNTGNRPVSNNDDLDDLLKKVIIGAIAIYLFYPSKQGFGKSRRSGFLNRFF